MSALAATYGRLSQADDAHLSVEELDGEAFDAAASADGWIRGAALAAGDAPAFDAIRGAAMAFTGEVDAKTVGLAIAWAAGPIIGVPLAAFAAERRVPALTLADVALRPQRGTERDAVIVRSVPFACLPGDAWARVDPMARPVPDEEALRDRFIEVIEALMEPVVEEIHRRTTAARAAIWGLAAGQIAYELAEARLTEIPIEDAVAEAERTVSGAPRLGRRRPELFVFESPGGAWFGLKGAACCRAYKWVGREGQYCLSCPLLDDEKRLADLRSWRGSLVGAG